MPEPSVLIVGASAAGLALAGVLVGRGADVALIEPGPAEPDAAPLEGIDLRWGLTLVGTLDVGTHVEAELSDGRIENYDAIVLAGADAAADPGSRPAAAGRISVLTAADDADALADRLTGGAPRHSTRRR